MIGSIRLWDIRASQAGFDNYNLEERDGESGINCSDIKTGKAEDWMNTRNQWGWPSGFASTVGRWAVVHKRSIKRRYTHGFQTCTKFVGSRRVSCVAPLRVASGN
jgi:hypothetical protein